MGDQQDFDLGHSESNSDQFDRHEPERAESEYEQATSSLIATALEEPSLVEFYVPARWPVAVPDGSGLTNARKHEILPFNPPVQFPDWLGPLNTVPQPNFVVISFHRIAHVETFDRRLLDYASLIATQTTGGGFGYTEAGKEQVAESQVDSEGNQLNFGKVPLPHCNQPATVFRLTTPIFEVSDDELDPISRAFNRCLEELNVVETAYATTANDATVRHTNRVTCFPIVPMVMFRNDGTVFYKGWFRVNPGLHLVPYAREELSANRWREIATRIQLLKNSQPLIRYAERSLSANRALEIDGDYAAAVLWTFTAGEIFLDSLLLMMAWEEIAFGPNPNVSVEDVVGWFSGRATLSGRIDTLYHQRLKGGWDPGSPVCPLYAWSNDVAAVRNLVVHAGYLPSENEATNALRTLGEVEGFVKNILCNDQNRTRYPRTAFMIVSLPGLERRGLFTGKLKRLLETEQVDWLESFRKFRDEFLEELAQKRPHRKVSGSKNT